ncbi:winged helix-turn-helix transcriptional regulator [Shewanella avicenniae]|uniref:Winged helix-turn-helix transcriptional regulator n=1 Tax=Shewanella avicenniae TaxID=2814294 RepID=A0ABX7QKY4_9GAMM|nr:MarR family winged helix-turn-helix transcriptional regulator [Shewanella avicenniae]QSX32114.1 winged helix-turn-helix transcriptional regulator [Shewanella avicenniae]
MQSVGQGQSLGHLTGLASRLFNRLLTARFKQAGIELTAEQWGIILTVHSHSAPLSHRQICDILYLDKSSVSRAISVLVSRGWLAELRSASDSRKKLLQLTAQAKAQVVNCLEIAQTVLNDAQQQLTLQDTVQTCHQLNQVIDSLRQLIPPFATDARLASSEDSAKANNQTPTTLTPNKEIS